MRDALLGIDVGSSSCKVVFCDVRAQIEAEATVGYETYYPKPGWVEQNPNDWWHATVEALRRLWESGCDPRRVAAIGVVGGNALVGVDATGNPVAPALFYSDTRAISHAKRLEHVLGVDKLTRITGNKAVPGAYSAPGILWMRDNLPDVYERVGAFLAPAGYVVLRLTGLTSMDYSRASMTLLFDLAQRTWSDEILSVLRLDSKILPKLYPSVAVVGELRPAATEETGLLAGTPVIAGATDTVAGVVGVGISSPGEWVLTLGTTGRIAVVAESPSFDPVFVNTCFAFERCWLIVAAMNGTGASLRWAERTFASSGGGKLSEPGARGLIFLPYVNGERSPIWNPDARGVLFGITAQHTPEDALRAVLEGTCFAFKHNEVQLRHIGFAPVRLILTGGGTRHPHWPQILADILGEPLEVSSVTSSEAVGAALLAGIGTHLVRDFDGIAEALKRERHIVCPNSAFSRTYELSFETYLRLYPCIEGLFSPRSL